MFKLLEFKCFFVKRHCNSLMAKKWLQPPCFPEIRISVKTVSALFITSPGGARVRHSIDSSKLMLRLKSFTLSQGEALCLLSGCLVAMLLLYLSSLDGLAGFFFQLVCFFTDCLAKKEERHRDLLAKVQTQ